jgi:DNA-directed RNA polymerase II subunit RPB1
MFGRRNSLQNGWDKDLISVLCRSKQYVQGEFMSAKLVPASGANFVEAGSVVSRQLYPRICTIQFGILSPAEIEQLAPKVISDNTAYAKNLPKLTGPNDPALGPSDRRVRCSTCGNTWFGCPGHHGVIRLPIPMYHVLYIDAVYKILQCFCWCCSWPKGDPDDARLTNKEAMGRRGMDRFSQMFMLGRGRFKCRQCEMPQPKYSKTGMVISRVFKPKQLELIKATSSELYESALRRFTPSEALDILVNIRDEHCVLMGMDAHKGHPSWMIFQNLMVLPPNARPAIMASEGSKRRGQDDMTSQTQDVLKACRMLRKSILRHTNPQLFPREKKGARSVVPPFASTEDGGLEEEEQAEDAPDLSALNVRIATSEFTISTQFLGDLQEAEVAALRFALPKTVVVPSPLQTIGIWELFPVLCEKLQNSVTILYDNSGKYAPQARQRTGGPKKSLMDRIVGKQGRVRGNCVAKRVDMSARTVIKPDAFLDVDELGIPLAFAAILTIQEDVNVRNLGRLQHAVQLGHGVQKGAARVLHASGQMTQLQYVDDMGRAKIRIQIGDLVERHLLDGDRVVFNRQPSLHKLSLMVHRIRLIEGLAISVPLAVVGPYNADFDGDEMNLHVLQSMLANAEAVELMAVSKNVMNPQNNEPCLSLVQDACAGGMLLTAGNTRLTRNLMHQCVGVIRYPVEGKERLPSPAGVDAATGDPYWTGKQLVSMILPSIFIEKRVRGAGPEVHRDDPQERLVLISDGHLLAGKLCKATLGTCTGGIIHRICTTFGQQAAIRFLSDFQRIVYTWLPSNGLSMGLKDCIIPADMQAHLNATTSQVDTLITDLTKESHALAEHMSVTEFARVEAYILTILTSNLDYASRLVMTGDPETTRQDGFSVMVAAGSKGNTNNLAQVKAYLGQQVVDGHRVGPSSVSNRTLPMFPVGALSAAARGFVMNSYTTGMEPHEFFNHMQGGREGLVATAVKTAETGYKYRSMAKGQETNMVQWDGSVRNAQGYIIEFIVGGDCMDPTKIERVQLDVIAMDDAAILRACGPVLTPRILELRDNLRTAFLTPLYRELATRVLLPLNIRDEMQRLTFNMQRKRTRFSEDAKAGSNEEYQACVDALVEDLLQLFPSREAATCLQLAVLYECRPEALRAAGISTHLFVNSLALEIKQRTVQALAQPGESVGILAAQSIGEPSTQFTLDAFHQAGLVQRRMTVGVPRLKELLHASEKITTPSMIVPLRNKHASKAETNRLARTLQFLCVDYVLHSSYVQLDPAGDGRTSPLTNMYKDHELMAHAAALYGAETSVNGSLSPWIVRLVLNRVMLLEHNLTPEDVCKEIARQVGDEYSFSTVFSVPNMSRWVVRLRLLGDDSERGCRLLHARVREDVLLGGICGIRDSKAIDLTGTAIDPSTGAVAKINECVIDTEGSSLMRVATREWADWENTITNDVQEVVRTLGIVAARALLFAELDRVISYDGGYVDPRHLKSLTNTMTHRGYMLPMTRHGINRVNHSVLMRASYEEPVDMIMQASMTAENDNLNGMCPAILAGQKAPLGTGTVSIQEDVEGRERGARARQSLSSREMLSVPKHSNKRVRENVDSGRQQAFTTSAAAEAAWAGQAVAPVGKRWAFVLTGVQIITNERGVYSSVKVVTIMPDGANGQDGQLRQMFGFRPSSPTDVLRAAGVL